MEKVLCLHGSMSLSRLNMPIQGFQKDICLVCHLNPPWITNQTPEQSVSGDAGQAKAKGMTAGCPLAMKGLYKLVTEKKNHKHSLPFHIYMAK